VEGLVLAGSAGLYERSLANDQGIRLCRRVIREQAGQIFHDPVHVTDQLVEDVYSMLQDRQYRRFLLKVAKATRDRYLLDDLPQVDVPALIVWGRNDLVTPPFVAEQFRDAIPHAELVFIEDCGHSPPIEQPHEFARLLHAFLQQRVRL
jgi:pimeloyl-ACP methyl ester carboxylesterase